MSNFRHVSNTWLIAVLIHPILFYFYALVMKWPTEGELMLAVLVAGFLFTIFSYLLCLVFFEMVRCVDVPVRWQFGLWIFSVSFCIPFGVLVTCGIFLSCLPVEGWPLMIPGVTAGVISVVTRYRQFVSVNTNTVSI